MAAAVICAQFAQGADAPVVRIDYVADSGLLLSHLLLVKDDAGTPLSRGVVKSHYLFSVGEILLYEGVDIDQRIHSRHTWLETGRREERLDYVFGPADTNLTSDESQRGLGVLRNATGSEMKLSRQDGALPTVQIRVRELLKQWRPDRVVALRRVYTAILGCNLQLASGDLLPILFPNIKRGAACAEHFRPSAPEPKRDQLFVTIHPELAQVLKKPFVPMNTPVP